MSYSGDDAIGWIREIVLNTPDPWGLARFWAGLLGGTPVQWYPGWVTLEPAPHGQRLSFQGTDGAGPAATATAPATATGWCTSTSWSATWPPRTSGCRKRARRSPLSTSRPGRARTGGRCRGGCTTTRRVTRSAWWSADRYTSCRIQMLGSQ